MPAATSPPSPDGALVTDVVCRTEGDGPAVRPPLTLHPDWSIDTGHDLDAERVAGAFGGYNSCIALADVMIPALREATQLWTRATAALIVPTTSGRWRLIERCGCGDRRDSYDRPEQAAAHARSVAHLARRSRVSLHDLGRLVSAVSDAYGDLTSPPSSYDTRLLTSEATAFRLWEAGISPAQVASTHQRVRARGPMTFRSYALAIYGAHDDAFVHAIVRVAGAPDAVEWALSTINDFDRSAPTARAAWLELGVSRQQAAQLTRSSYTVREAHQLAAALNVVPIYAATVLADWARAGLVPAVSDLVRLHEMRGEQWYAPTPQALSPSRRAIESGVLGVTPTQAGLLLVACGSPALARQALLLGVRRLADLDLDDIAARQVTRA